MCWRIRVVAAVTASAPHALLTWIQSTRGWCYLIYPSTGPNEESELIAFWPAFIWKEEAVVWPITSLEEWRYKTYERCSKNGKSLAILISKAAFSPSIAVWRLCCHVLLPNDVSLEFEGTLLHEPSKYNPEETLLADFTIYLCFICISTV